MLARLKSFLSRVRSMLPLQLRYWLVMRHQGYDLVVCRSRVNPVRRLGRFHGFHTIDGPFNTKDDVMASHKWWRDMLKGKAPE